MDPDDLTANRPTPSQKRPLGRLKRRAEFQRASKGKRSFTGAFTLQGRRRESAESDSREPRVGLTVTKKIGNAAARNRIRRRLRAALRAAEGLEAREDHDYVLLARREALTRRFDALVGDVEGAFSGLARGAGVRNAPAVRATKVRDRQT
jgi:ribonuclease P protein component